VSNANSKSVLLSFLLVLAAIGVASGLATTVQGANITVNHTSDTIIDDELCTLREAIINANYDDQSGSTDCAAGNGPDTITLPANTYTLTIPGTGEDAALTGGLDLIDDLTYQWRELDHHHH